MKMIPNDVIRGLFSQAMSAMYRKEVPQYGDLLALVAEVNAVTLAGDAQLRARFVTGEESERLGQERHGAIRVGTAEELANLRRAFALMGMQPVGYYDLAPAGVPVHSTAFRPVDRAALARNPFRVFTSLLRLELIEDAALRDEARDILARRRIFTDRALALIDAGERQGGLDEAQAREFVLEMLHTFRWQARACVSRETYARLHAAHRLIADVVSFPNPHINHLTPRTLDIDAAQAAMQQRGLAAKEEIEGPPRRRVPILLRQTSFKALEEQVVFDEATQASSGTHTARFGEIEQRGIALTRQGRKLYDELLAQARDIEAGLPGASYAQRLQAAFDAFPDDLPALRRAGLGFFRYELTPAGRQQAETVQGLDLDALVAHGLVQCMPITYEDFLPVSAAGIFQSNLGGETGAAFSAASAQAAFEAALGAGTLDAFALYEAEQAASITALRRPLSAVASA